LVNAVGKELGGIHILINNAGVRADALTVRLSEEDWDRVVDTDLKAAFLTSKAALRPMMRQRWGRIINITSIFGQIGQVGQANYSASKAGLIGLTMALAREVGSRSITVNAVAPGYIETAMTASVTAEMKDTILERIPLGRAGRDTEVASAVAFLASEEAGYITGHVLNVNGGLLMG
jgi:3-oxoacyl-[acyl-carrier protein] reductase